MGTVTDDIEDAKSKCFLKVLEWDVVDLSCSHSEKKKEKDAASKSAAACSNQCCKCKKSASFCTHSNTMLPEDVKKYCKKHMEEMQLPIHQRLLKSNSKNGQNPYLVPLSIFKKKTSCNKIDIVDLGKNLKSHFDSIFEKYIHKINAVIIENQIGNLAGRMNVLQGMISQYFIMKNITRIDFISATNKLKLFKCLLSKPQHQNKLVIENDLEDVIENEKKIYKMRKEGGKKICKSLLLFYPTLHIWIKEYDQHKKRDDLADCFLQGYYYMHLNYNQTHKTCFDLDAFLSSNVSFV